MSRPLARRRDRLGEPHVAGHTERMVQQLAEEFGLDPMEVRREMAEAGERIRRLGPGTVVEVIGRCAAEFDLAVDEHWGEYERITAMDKQRVTTG